MPPNLQNGMSTAFSVTQPTQYTMRPISPQKATHNMPILTQDLLQSATDVIFDDLPPQNVTESAR